MYRSCCRHLHISKESKVLAVLHPEALRIELIALFPVTGPPNKKRKRDITAEGTDQEPNLSRNILQMMDLSTLLSKLCDVDGVMINGFFINVQRECILLLVENVDILWIDGESNLL